MSKKLRHRGPIGLEYMMTLMLSFHERLAIVDPTSGKQPLISPSGKLVLQKMVKFIIIANYVCLVKMTTNLKQSQIVK